MKLYVLNPGGGGNGSGTLTGGGTIATGGYTLTVPATGTAALLATANVFTVNQAITLGTANVSGLTISGQSLTGSNAQNLLDLSGTWNTTGAPTGIKLDITNTASGAAAKLLDLCVGGSSLFGVTKAGYMTAVRFGADTAGIRYFYETGGSTYFSSGGTDILQLAAGGVFIKSTAAPLVFENDVHIVLRTGNGSKIGTGTTQKLAFWNATPVAQPAHIADPSGGATVDTEARTAINAILAWQATLGLTAAS
jgi:hypothetical protein